MSSGPHPVFVYGPIGLIVASGVVSIAIAPVIFRAIGKRRGLSVLEGTGLAPKRGRLLAFVVAVATFWLVALSAGALLITFDPSEVEGRLPGDHVDTTVLAHAVPPFSNAATAKLVARLVKIGTEDSLAMAARLEPNPYWAIRHLTEHGFRTHAGRFTLGNPGNESCPLGMDALAEAQRGGALQEAFVACRNVPGDAIGVAAFKMGDFRVAVGPEAETIVSRMPRPPRGEPTCLAGAFDVPPLEMPLCRLIHAEMKEDTRDEVLASPRPADRFARRWASALALERADRGELPEGDAFTLDAARFVRDPIVLFESEPVAIDATLRDEHASLGPETRLWLDLVFAAERSAFGKHEEALAATDRAIFVLDGLATTVEVDESARRVAAAIALRAGDLGRAVEHAGDHLAALGPLRTTWREDPAADLRDAIAIAIDPSLPAALLLRDLPEAARPGFLDFLRERYPGCPSCGFFGQLAHHLRRRDIAEAVGDDKLVGDLDPVLARFEAVVMNRTLALSLTLASEEIGR